jgi:hypothetical protein
MDRVLCIVPEVVTARQLLQDSVGLRSCACKTGQSQIYFILHYDGNANAKRIKSTRSGKCRFLLL